MLTGATGFIGQHLAAQLVQAGAEVAVLLREGYSGTPLPGLLNPLRPQLHLVYADLRNFNLTSRAIRDAAPEQVIHLAAVGVSEPFLPVNPALSHNLDGTLNLTTSLL
ncbi:MAG: GDP-mannose 4,6-dehydratase [Chloroflexi bacterium]|nr:GDP-mannose 4,6-dehydratase [Chloroflexota bacterium]